MTAFFWDRLVVPETAAFRAMLQLIKTSHHKILLGRSAQEDD
jgi:hypothetical protein